MSVGFLCVRCHSQLSQVWTFTFCGSGRSKYTNELLEVACNFEYEYSEHLRNGTMKNWLCNLTRRDGCWFPMDLMQEHGIRQLKAMTPKAQDDPFGNDHFKNIVSWNIGNFVDVKASMRTNVGLGQKSGAHRRKKQTLALKRLRERMSESQLHKFVRGRLQEHQAENNFANGYHTFANTPRISDFISN